MKRLKNRKDFLKVSEKGKSVACKAFVVQFLPANEFSKENNKDTRVGFTASKRVGNSVQRNRSKRRLREIVRIANAQTPLRDGIDIVLIARKNDREIPFDQMIKDYKKIANKI